MIAVKTQSLWQINVLLFMKLFFLISVRTNDASVASEAQKSLLKMKIKVPKSSPEKRQPRRFYLFCSSLERGL